MSYISEQVIHSKLLLDASDINNDIDSIIKVKLKDEVEGKCYEDGYIVNDSIQIIKRSIGKVKTTNNKSKISYDISYKAKIISPSEGDEMKVYISNLNKMGVISYVKLGDKDVESSDNSPLIIMVPQEYFGGSTRNIDDLTVGQSIDVIVVGSRVKYGSDKIQVVAKPK